LGTTAVRYNVEHAHQVAIGEGDNERSAFVDLGIEVTWTDENDEPVEAYPFDLTLHVGGHFAWEPKQYNRETFAAWLEWNGVYLLWPYARAYITALTSTSPYPPLTINTLRVPDPPAPEAMEAAEASSAAARTTPRSRASKKPAPKKPASKARTGASGAAKPRRSST
jgi:preprotein translocase subunit SecB